MGIQNGYLVVVIVEGLGVGNRSRISRAISILDIWEGVGLIVSDICRVSVEVSR